MELGTGWGKRALCDRLLFAWFLLSMFQKLRVPVALRYRLFVVRCLSVLVLCFAVRALKQYIRIQLVITHQIRNTRRCTELYLVVPNEFLSIRLRCTAAKNAGASLRNGGHFDNIKPEKRQPCVWKVADLHMGVIFLEWYTLPEWRLSAGRRCRSPTTGENGHRSCKYRVSSRVE